MAEAPPRVEPIQHYLMTLPNFVRLGAEMAGRLERMEQRGLISRKQPAVPQV